MYSSMNVSVEDAMTSASQSFIEDQRYQSESHAPSSTRDQSEMRRINSFQTFMLSENEAEDQEFAKILTKTIQG